MAALTPRPLILLWDYPTNAISTDLTFNLYSQTNLAIAPSNWVRVATYPAQNWYSNGVWTLPVQGTNYVVTVTNLVLPGVQWYYVTASNFWSDSDPSNTLGLPPVPAQSVNMRAQRGW